MKGEEIPRIPRDVNRSHRTARSMITRQSFLITYSQTVKTSDFIVLKVNMPVIALSCSYTVCELKILLLFLFSKKIQHTYTPPSP